MCMHYDYEGLICNIFVFQLNEKIPKWIASVYTCSCMSNKDEIKICIYVDLLDLWNVLHEDYCMLSRLVLYSQYPPEAGLLS